MTLERRRAPPKGLKGLPEGTSPDALTSPEVRKKILETYAAAHAFVICEGKVDGAKATLELPKDLPAGTYLVKVFGAQGDTAIGSARIEVEEFEEPEEPEKTGK